jgi:hypothetical protein
METTVLDQLFCFEKKTQTETQMLEYMVDLPFPGVPTLCREVSACIGSGGWLVYTISRGNFYISSITDLERHNALSSPIENTQVSHVKLPVPALAITAAVHSESSVTRLILGANQQIYTVLGRLLTSKNRLEWFGDANYDLLSKFYLPANTYLYDS